MWYELQTCGRTYSLPCLIHTYYTWLSKLSQSCLYKRLDHKPFIVVSIYIRRLIFFVVIMVICPMSWVYLKAIKVNFLALVQCDINTYRIMDKLVMSKKSLFTTSNPYQMRHWLQGSWTTCLCTHGSPDECHIASTLDAVSVSLFTSWAQNGVLDSTTSFITLAHTQHLIVWRGVYCGTRGRDEWVVIEKWAPS